MLLKGRYLQTGLPTVQGSFFLLFLANTGFLGFFPTYLDLFPLHSSLNLILTTKDESLCECLVVFSLLVVVSDGVKIWGNEALVRISVEF